MNILTIEHLSKSYTERVLFSDADFSMNEGEKVAIVGTNGTGKSTLLRIIAGLEEADSGEIVTRRNLNIRFLPQEPDYRPEETVLQSIIRENTDGTHAAGNAWETEVQAKTFLTKLGVSDFDAKMGKLSGGQRKRAALVSVLLSDAELLIMDEPTNHLDGEMCAWLEERLKEFRGCILMVTHDRYFLDSVANRIVETDQGKLYSYKANYSEYLALRAERLDMEKASERKRRSILRKELSWIMRGAKARTTKQKGRIQRYEALLNEEAPSEEESFAFSSAASRLGRTTIELKDIRTSYGDKTVIRGFSYVFLKNDRIGIIGRNGAGKSTLLQIIAGRLRPDAGTVEIGQTVKPGYFSQENEELPEAMKVIDYIRETAEYIRTEDGTISASQMLERFLFPGYMQHTRIEKLSGGEKRRLYLIKLLMEAPNVLLLDEPTNSLDIRTMTILEDYIDSFPGIVITVSHDRYFLDRTVRRIFAFEEDGMLRQYEGGYTDYALRKEAEAESFREPAAGGAGKQEPSGKEKGQRSRGPQKLKFSYKEQRDYETIEAEISALEEKIAAVETGMLASARDFVKLNQLAQEKEALSAALEEKMERWMYLEELAAKIAAQQS